jgi:hypothetical protein
MKNLINDNIALNKIATSSALLKKFLKSKHFNKRNGNLMHLFNMLKSKQAFYEEKLQADLFNLVNDDNFMDNSEKNMNMKNQKDEQKKKEDEQKKKEDEQKMEEDRLTADIRQFLPFRF